MSALPIYLDAHSTTAVDPAVLDAMLPWLNVPANSHSAHAMGSAAAAAVEEARAQVAATIGAEPEEIVFVPSATMATNIALRSLVRPGTTVLRSAIEHPCVVETLEATGAAVLELPVGEDGLVDPAAIEPADGATISAVAVMAVNNEVGTIQPIAEIAQVCAYVGAPLFVDMAQAVGRIAIDVHAQGVSAGAISSHKIYGPQGVGALYCRRELMAEMRPLAAGGGQERRLSPGTLPTALCVGFGAACAIASQVMTEETKRIAMLRNRLLELLRSGCPGLVVNGSIERRVASNLSVTFPGIGGEEMLACMPDVIASTGSACSSGAITASPVLRALGLDEERMAGTIRFGVGRYTTEAEIDRAAAMAIHAWKALTSDGKAMMPGGMK